MVELLDANYDADKLPEGKLRFVALSFFKLIEIGIITDCLSFHQVIILLL